VTTKALDRRLAFVLTFNWFLKIVRVPNGAREDHLGSRKGRSAMRIQPRSPAIQRAGFSGDRSALKAAGRTCPQLTGSEASAEEERQ